jgi:hypothetical protein
MCGRTQGGGVFVGHLMPNGAVESVLQGMKAGNDP